MGLIDKFREQLGLPQKDEYSFAEVQFAVHRYMPLWVEEAYGLLLRRQPMIQAQIIRDGYYDLDILPRLSSENRAEIVQSVSPRLSSEDREEITLSVSKKLDKEPRSIRISTTKLDIGTFLECFNYLRQRNSSIKRIYKKPDLSRFKSRSSLIWNAYSIEDVEYNSNIVFENLHGAY